MHHRSHDQGVCIQGRVWSASEGGAVCIHRGLHPGGLGRSPMDTIGYGQQAGGAHPTGTHSCLKYCYTIAENFLFEEKIA